MKQLLVATLFLSLCFQSHGWEREYKEGYALLKAIELSDLVVVGRVTGKEYVYRENIRVKFTTDITVTVDKAIKGVPNAGKNTVKFMIRGGQGIDPLDGELTDVNVSDEPEFNLNEKVMLFLFKNDSGNRRVDSAFVPYDGFSLVRGIYGKRLIEDEKTTFLYFANSDVTDNSLKSVELPLEVAIQLGLAYDANKDAAILLENIIKNIVQSDSNDTVFLTSTTVETLKRDAKKIIKKRENK